MTHKYHIDADIRKAKTLPASFYRDPATFELLRQKIFYKSWQWVGHNGLLTKEQNTLPLVLLEGFLDEPMLLTRDKEDSPHCLSNVCTHRGNTVVKEAAMLKKLSCGYHGRRFSLDGRFEFMPEFKEVVNFPASCDDLHSFPLIEWGPCLFAGLHPAFELTEVLQQMKERVDFLNPDSFKYNERLGKEYLVNAHWALYCDNYLEGFHIPFVHNDLNAVLDYGDYETVIYDYMSLQIGYAEGTEEVFEFPEGHIDHGKKVAAYYFWVFPNMMFNFYPWGLSVNIVEPLGMDKTRVKFLSFVSDETRLNTGAGAGLDKVELEDEEVVEGVQLGVNSRFYQAGRFSPTKEKGVHHFHRLLAQFINASD